jgi:hypothetical protein
MAVATQPLVQNLDEVLAQMKATTDPEELATLILLASELYSAGQCVCEVKAPGSDDALLCQHSINTERDKMFNTLLVALRNVKEAG